MSETKYSISERGSVRERDTACDKCSQRLFPSEPIFILKAEADGKFRRTEPLCKSCTETLLGGPVPEAKRVPASEIMTLRAAAQAALDVQEAVNISGMVYWLDQIIKNVLYPLAIKNGHGTKWVNEHPIVTLFTFKIASVNQNVVVGEFDKGKFKATYDAVKEFLK